MVNDLSVSTGKLIQSPLYDVEKARIEMTDQMYQQIVRHRPVEDFISNGKYHEWLTDEE
ncbi:hypothetical protein GGR79_001573 [Xanthomonas arboricola]|nr:hypothetical protein [Xanthomonas arboricola]